jgi:xanthine dehydrogenase accessory factor
VTQFNAARQITPLLQALAWFDQGIGTAVGTVVQTWGSAPQKAGSLIAVNARGEFSGSVSGGCVESSVIDASLKSLSDGSSRLLHFEVSEETAWAVGLACGGTIDIRVEPLREDPSNLLPSFRRVASATSSRRPLVIASRLRDGFHQLIDPAMPATTALEEEAFTASRRDLSGVADVEGERIFLHVFNPPYQLLLLGAVHIAQIAAPIARLAGFEVIVVDHREMFAAQERFPDTQLRVQRPEDALRELGLDHRTGVVALTHNPEVDDPALIKAIQSNAFYVGALGSRKSHAARVKRLKDAGAAERDIAQIQAPAGLDIGAMGPAEIAISIVAQAIAAFRGRLRAQPATAVTAG